MSKTVTIPRAKLARLLKLNRQLSAAIEELLRDEPANDNAVAQIRANRAVLANWHQHRIETGRAGNEDDDWAAAVRELPFFVSREDVREVRRPVGKRRSGRPKSRG